MKHVHDSLHILLICEACSVLLTMVFLLTFGLSLSPTDGAYGRFTPFDSSMYMLILFAAGVLGLLVWPFAYLTLRDRRLAHCLPLVVGAVAAWIVVVTPASVIKGFTGSFVVLALALLVCRWLFRTQYARGYCQSCGYSLTGNVSGVCPECGTRVARQARRMEERSRGC